MKNKHYIIFDFETDSIDPEICSPIQIGAVAVDSTKLEIIPHSEFYSWCCPDDIDDLDYYKNHKATLDFHCKNYNISIDELLERIKNSPPEKTIFENFDTYLSKYHTKPNSQTIFTAPILAAYNGYNFDFPILDRLCKKYKRAKDNKQNLYFNRDSIDILKIVSLWFSPLDDITSFSMDSVREYVGMAKAGAHDAIIDVRQEAALLIKFLKLHKQLAKRISFKDSFLETVNV